MAVNKVNKKAGNVKKRLLLLNICIVLVLAGAFLYTVMVGGQYTLRTRAFFSAGMPEVTVHMDTDGIVEHTGTRLENEELILEFRALSPGETTLRVNYSLHGSGDTRPLELYHFQVTNLGVLFDKNAWNFNGSTAVIIALIACLVLAAGFMLWLFWDCWRKGLFSYQMTAYGGIMIFSAIFAAFLIYKMLNHVLYSIKNFLAIVLDVGNGILVALSPIMLVVSVFLVLSNIWLMKNEGYRPANALGILFAFLLVAVMFFISSAFLWELFAGSRIYQEFKLIVKYMLCYFECMFVSTMACAYLATKYKPPYDRDYLIILGCGIRKDGGLTPLLKGRADSAIRFEQEQYAAAGHHAVFVPSGGQGPDEVIAEAEAMKRYLLSQGIPAEQILCEDKSTSTYENMKYSRQVIESTTDHFDDKKIGFATTNYHVFRGYIMAQKNGFEVKGISAKTKAYFYPNAFLREFAGLLWEQKIRHLVYISLTILFFMLLGRL